MTHRQPLKNSELRAQEQFFQLSGKNKTLGTPYNVNGVGYRGYIFEKSRFNAENSYDPYVNTCFEVVNALSELERGCSSLGLSSINQFIKPTYKRNVWAQNQFLICIITDAYDTGQRSGVLLSGIVIKLK